MTDIPNLTDSQAALLRFAYYASGSIYDIADADPDNPEPVLFAWKDYGGRVEATPLGRAALAAYDAEQRRAIRVEAMRECFKAVYVLDVDSRHAIEDLIAKEESNG